MGTLPKLLLVKFKYILKSDAVVFGRVSIIITFSSVTAKKKAYGE